MAELLIDHSGWLDAPTDLVWRGLIDLGAVDEWHDRVDEGAPGEAGPGLERRWRVGSRWLVGGIVEAEPGRRLTLLVRDGASLLRILRVVVELDPAEGATRYRLELVAETSSLAAPLIPWLRFRAQVELHRAVRGFRAWIEERARDDRRSAARSRASGGESPGRARLPAIAPTLDDRVVAEPRAVGARFSDETVGEALVA